MVSAGKNLPPIQLRKSGITMRDTSSFTPDRFAAPFDEAPAWNEVGLFADDRDPYGDSDREPEALHFIPVTVQHSGGVAEGYTEYLTEGETVVQSLVGMPRTGETCRVVFDCC